MSEIQLPWEKFVHHPSGERRTSVIYYGGKSRDADWILSYFPPHTTFVDVFGGGGAVIFRKRPSTVDVYNDVGNVSNFFQCLRDHSDELYRRLYFRDFGRDTFEQARRAWPLAMQRGDLLTWAENWYITVAQGYTHEEYGESWRVSKQVNTAAAFASHVDDLPYFVDRLRRMQIERLDFSEVIPLYDTAGTLFYCDPPYLHETRVDTDNYVHEMPYERHVELLNLLLKVQGQVVLSGYPSPLYDDALKGWRRVTKTTKSAIQNSSSMSGRGDRTEALWIKEHHYGLWSAAPADVAGVSVAWSSVEEPVSPGRSEPL